MAGEVHREEEEGQFLHHRNAALVGQGERERFYFWSFFSSCGLRVQRRPWPFSGTSETDEVFEVLGGDDEMVRRRASQQTSMRCQILADLWDSVLFKVIPTL